MPGRVPALPARLRRGSPGGPLGRLQDGAAGRGAQRVPAPRRGGLPARVERLGHDLLRALQPALRLLPELRHQPDGPPGPGGARSAGARDRGPHARAAGGRLPQREPRHARARGAAGAGVARGGGPWRTLVATRVQHQCIRFPGEPRAARRHRRHLHAGHEAVERGTLPDLPASGRLRGARAPGHPRDAPAGGAARHWRGRARAARASDPAPGDAGTAMPSSTAG
jgi:hypothetical protein